MEGNSFNTISNSMNFFKNLKALQYSTYNLIVETKPKKIVTIEIDTFSINFSHNVQYFDTRLFVPTFFAEQNFRSTNTNVYNVRTFLFFVWGQRIICIAVF